jgi:hypothetical protein
LKVTSTGSMLRGFIRARLPVQNIALRHGAGKRGMQWVFYGLHQAHFKHPQKRRGAAAPQ